MTVAIVVEAHPGAAGATLESLVWQSTPVGRIVVTEPDGLATEWRGAQSSWVWLLDAGVVCEPTALASLVDAAARLSPATCAALLASTVRAADGGLDRASLPILLSRRPERVLAAVDHRLVALRAARSGSLLVRAEALRVADIVPRAVAPTSTLEWTARLLRDRDGMLVPASVVVRREPTRRPGIRERGAALASGARMLAALERDERVRFAAQLWNQTGYRS